MTSPRADRDNQKKRKAPDLKKGLAFGQKKAIKPPAWKKRSRRAFAK